MADSRVSRSRQAIATVEWPLIALFLSLFASTLHAGDAGPDWPNFLGPRHNAMSAEKGLNWDWTTRPPKVLWKVPLGNGFSSMTVVGDRVFTMAKRGTRDMVVCLSSKDGKELWSYDAVPSYIDFQKQGAGPRSTPTYHDGKIYCLFAQGELLCLTADGKLVWEKNIFKDSGSTVPSGIFYWGVSASPFIDGDHVIVQPGGDKENSVVAFHKNTGQIVWSVGSDPIGYATPIEITSAGVRQLVCPTGLSILGLDPVKGTILWRYEFGSQFKTNCASPVWSDDILFVSAAYGTGSAALSLVKNSGGWEVKEKWRDKKNMQNLFATSIVLDKKVYGVSGDIGTTFLRCLDLDTGKINWDDRLAKRAHLLWVDGRILVWDESRDLRYFEPNAKTFESKGEVRDLLTGKAWAAPALAGGKLYLRDDRSILCLDLK